MKVLTRKSIESLLNSDKDLRKEFYNLIETIRESKGMDTKTSNNILMDLSIVVNLINETS